MCGIAGMLSMTDRPIERPELVRAMMDRLVHRGPDESGEYVSPRRQAVLGHRRLRIIDLSSGRQPLTNEDGTVVVSFNGEIYDFQPMVAALSARGHRFATRTDTEVIVHLYEEQGAACLAQLNGMLAVALWDDRTGTLLLARDRMGKKPLYYAVVNGVLAFASELHALTAMPGLSRELDDRALDLCLTLGYIPAPYTIYRDVRKLPAGHALSVKAGQPGALVPFRYDTDPPSGVEPLGWEDAKQALIARLRAATQARMVSDVPLGCFLSGGVDSSTVLSFMAELSSQPVKTFSIGFPQEEFSELRYARTVARHFGTEHHEYVLEPEGIDILDQLVEHFGEPFADSSALPTWYLSKLTRKSVTVALTGDGGDELFGGYDWYRTAQRLSTLARLMPPGLGAALGPWRQHGPRLIRKIAKAAAFAGYPEGWRFARQREILSPELKANLYEPAFAARVG
ncbi:MAG TPA: asparagine synthase (glutamine-hydrolyzing), partial [Nitrospirales bacterium]|nr:asparagine synthase (glutamine-hydrolyzing) [Nitrospirales bacterium]